MRLALAAPSAGLFVVLSGPLGAGKTEFAKGLARGLGIAAEQVTSPTFAICNEYVAPDARRMAHADAYRLSSGRELEDAGLLDWLAPGTLVAVEWGESFPEVLPADRLEVVLSRVDGARRVNAVAFGSTSCAALAEWERQISMDAELEVRFDSEREPA